MLCRIKPAALLSYPQSLFSNLIYLTFKIKISAKNILRLKFISQKYLHKKYFTCIFRCKKTLKQVTTPLLTTTTYEYRVIAEAQYNN